MTCARRDVLQKHMSHSLFSSKIESLLASAEEKDNYFIFILWVKFTVQVSEP